MRVIQEVDLQPYRFLVFAEETGHLTVIPEGADVLDNKPWSNTKSLPSYKPHHSHSTPIGKGFTLVWV